MARKKKVLQEKGESIFWKHGVGESIEGVFNGFQRTDKANCISLLVKGNEKLVSVSTVLLGFFKVEKNNVTLAERLRIGKDKIKILHIKNIKRAFIYRLWVNDVEQVQEFMAKKIDAKDIFKVVDKKT